MNQDMSIFSLVLHASLVVQIVMAAMIPPRELGRYAGIFGAVFAVGTVAGPLIGGVLVGLGFGWLLDHFVGTAPWGMVGGLLIGMGASIFGVVRKAMQLSAQASAKAPEGQAGEDTGGGSTAPKQKRD